MILRFPFSVFDLGRKAARWEALIHIHQGTMNRVAKHIRSGSPYFQELDIVATKNRRRPRVSSEGSANLAADWAEKRESLAAQGLTRVGNPACGPAEPPAWLSVAKRLNIKVLATIGQTCKFVTFL